MNFDQIMETLIKLATPTKTIKEEEIIKYFAFVSLKAFSNEPYFFAISSMLSSAFTVCMNIVHPLFICDIPLYVISYHFRVADRVES